MKGGESLCGKIINVQLDVQWMVDERELRVIHYTLGPLKPWDWWTSWLLRPVDVWQVHDFNLHEFLFKI